MIQMLFSLRYQSQLRRTRPELYASLEAAILKTVKASGGEVRIERRYLSAFFHENAIGFWLDMLTLLERLLEILGGEARELYGHICLLGRDLDEAEVKLCRSLPSGGTGLWCDYSVQRDLSPYVLFENNNNETRGIPQGYGYNRIESFIPPAARDINRIFPYRERILKILRTGTVRNAVLAGPRFIGKRDGLRRYCSGLLKGLPPLMVTFGAGGNGLFCFIDAYNSNIRELIAPFAGSGIRELDSP